MEFMHALRGLLRSSLAVCVGTFPAHLYSKSVQRAVMHLSDTVVALHSFKGETKSLRIRKLYSFHNRASSGTGETVSEAFKDYSGIFQIRKLPRLNSLVSHMPDSLTFVFTMGRRKLAIEPLHLQPEISRSTQEKPAKAGAGALCLPGTKNSLEF